MTDFAACGLIYLGTPYSKYRPELPRDAGLRQAFIDAANLAARLLKEGAKVYSPIAHTHPLAIHGGLDPLDLRIWLPFDEAMMAKADCLIVAKLEGWEDSFGIKHEIEVFKKAGKPVMFLDPESLTITSTGQDRSAA